MYERNHLLRSYGVAALPVLAIPQGEPPPAPADVRFEKT
jgi:hypothetical protein